VSNIIRKLWCFRLLTYFPVAVMDVVPVTLQDLVQRAKVHLALVMSSQWIEKHRDEWEETTSTT